MGEQLVAKSSYSMAAAHFKKQVSSHVAWVINEHLKFQTIKFPTNGTEFHIKSVQNLQLMPY